MLENAIVTAIAARLTLELAPPRSRLVPFMVEGNVAGYLNRERAACLATMGDALVVDEDSVRFAAGIDTEPARTQALDRVARALAAQGQLTAWRDERYAAAARLEAAPWFFLERAAARYFGIHTHAVHANGLVRRERGTAMWIARRSAVKAIDPGMLDNLVGGGVAAGETLAGALIREAGEEAGIDPETAANATSGGVVELFREQLDGVQRESIHVHDLWLPPEFVPVAMDGEVAGHRIVALSDAARLVANTGGPDVVTADASLVIVDCLLRHGAVAADSPAYRALAALRCPPGVEFA